MANELARSTAAELARRIRAREASAREVAAAFLTRIETWNPRIGALVDHDPEDVLAQAAAADEAQSAGRPLGPLHGVPVTIKSSIDVAGRRIECGSLYRRGRVAERDAAVVARLRAAGAIVLGVTNAADLLMAYETDNRLYGRTNHPLDAERTPGGSSGGEAAAIAAGCSPAGFGSDGGGSVRVPAHFSGICGLKPTPGLISRAGHWPVCVGPGARMGLVGPLARSVEDLQLLVAATAGADPADPCSAPVKFEPPTDERLRGARIGWCAGGPGWPATAETAAAVERAARALEDQGFRLQPFSFAGLEDFARAWWALFGVAGAILTRPMRAGREADLHPASLGLLATDEEVEAFTAEKLFDAWVLRDRIRAKLAARMDGLTALICPTAAIPAFRHGERGWTVAGERVGYIEAFRFSQIFNLTGHPAAVVPAGRSPEGLPIGVQVVAAPFDDAVALAVAGLVERRLPEFLAVPAP